MSNVAYRIESLPTVPKLRRRVGMSWEMQYESYACNALTGGAVWEWGDLRRKWVAQGLSVPNSFGRAVKICRRQEVQVWNSIMAKCPRAEKL